MKMFSERNPMIVGTIGCALTAVVVAGALQYDRLPMFNHGETYTAFFSEAGGLTSGAAVQVSGVRVGKVESIALDGPRVLVKFSVNRKIHIGERSEAAIKTKTVLGAKIIDVISRGDANLTAPIPLDRTTSPYQLPDALGDLTMTISGLNTDNLSDSLAVLTDTFKDTPPDLKIAVEGVERFSRTIDRRDTQLRDLLANANKVSAVLAERSDQIVSLVSNTNALLTELQNQRVALDQISNNVSAAAQQVKGFIGENRDTLKGTLGKLNGVLAIVDNRKERVQKSITMLNAYAMSLGESLGSGPFFKAYVVNLLPGQFLQPFIDAAFSDLGLDPHVLLPSQRTDPQVGQPATPALPMPYPRTGQGGQPNLTLPDAITGNPGDPRYPFRPPLPAPAPGGPPPGPPAIPESPPGPNATTSPAPQSDPVDTGQGDR
jgi:phospholipid/cholesterol/gamma-HCH transport system substrate-binding protein